MTDDATTPRPDRSTFPYPWLRHGTAITDINARLSVANAAALARLDDTVVRVPMVSEPAANDVQVGRILNPDKWMTVSTRTVGDKLHCSYQGTVGSRYQIVQNIEAFSFFDAVLGQGAACIEAAGRLGPHGARTFMIAAMPDMLEIVPGDPIERHILLTTTHDGSGLIEAVFLHWRTLTNVGVQFTSERRGRFRIRHTKSANSRLKTAQSVLNANESYWTRAKNIYKWLAKRDVSTAYAQSFVEHMFPDTVKTDAAGNEISRHTSDQAQRAREKLLNLFEGECPGSDVAGSTAWGLYNCAAFFVQEERGSRSKRVGAWEVSTFGSGAKMRARAWEWLTRGA